MAALAAKLQAVAALNFMLAPNMEKGAEYYTPDEITEILINISNDFLGLNNEPVKTEGQKSKEARC